MPEKPTLFLSYRRIASADLARYLHDRLVTLGIDVFFDVESINAGRFGAIIEKEIINRDHFMVILSAATLDSEWVRREIQTALKHQRNIIPVTTQDFDFSKLPDEIKMLGDYSGISYNYQDPDHSLKQIKKAVGLADKPPSQNRLRMFWNVGGNPTLVGWVTIIGVVLGFLGVTFSSLVNRPDSKSAELPTATDAKIAVVVSVTSTPQLLLPSTNTITPPPSVTPTTIPSSTNILAPISVSIVANTPVPSVTFSLSITPPFASSTLSTSAQNTYSYRTVTAGTFADQWGQADNAFLIDTFNVTNAQYAAFLTKRDGNTFDANGVPFVQSNAAASGHLQQKLGITWQAEPGYEAYPVVSITWAGAQAFCNSLGRRLPTATERHKAAAWRAEGSELSPYPWGSDPPNPQRANFGMTVGGPSKIDAYPAGQSAVGVYDLAGNVNNWTSSRNGNSMVKLGGAFDSAPEELRTDAFDVALPQTASANTGFRCAQ